jgi:hypothetical protein
MKLRLPISFLLIGLLAGLVFGHLGNVQALGQEEESPKQKDIRRLMISMGSGENAVQMVEIMIAESRKNNPSVPDYFWDEFMLGVNADDLIDLSVPSYDKHLSHADIKKAIKFYESPAGERVAKALPAITSELVDVGVYWAGILEGAAIERLTAQGKWPPQSSGTIPEQPSNATPSVPSPSPK